MSRIHFVRIFLALLLIAALAAPALAGRTLTQAKAQTVYVPAYSHVYQGPKNRPYNLAVMLSIRNVCADKAITVTSVRFFDSDGTLVRDFFDEPVTVPPMGTKEVYIMEKDSSGGSGANFLVKWKSDTVLPTPVIQAVMIGTASTQGISFVCDGVVIEEE